MTLLGQNVNSYADFSHVSPTGERGRPFDQPEDVYAEVRRRGLVPASGRLARGLRAWLMAGGFLTGPLLFPPSPPGPTDTPPAPKRAQGFSSVYKPRRSGAVTFAELLDRVASVDAEMRVRFTSPHPKDFGADVLQAIAAHANVCKQLHMPAQSGSSAVLAAMRRGYTREAYDALAAAARAALPGLALSTDMISGFCGEGEEDHAATLDLMHTHAFEQAFMFAYSDRERTYAARHLVDDVPAPVKQRRLAEVIDAYRAGLARRTAEERGRTHLVLVEGPSRRSDAVLTGRTDTFKRVLFDDVALPGSLLRGAGGDPPRVRLQPGDYVAVAVDAEQGSGTLRARALARTTLQEFVAVYGSAVPLRLEQPRAVEWLAHGTPAAAPGAQGTARQEPRAAAAL